MTLNRNFPEMKSTPWTRRSIHLRKANGCRRRPLGTKLGYRRNLPLDNQLLAGFPGENGRWTFFFKLSKPKKYIKTNSCVGFRSSIGWPFFIVIMYYFFFFYSSIFNFISLYFILFFSIFDHFLFWISLKWRECWNISFIYW